MEYIIAKSLPKEVYDALNKAKYGWSKWGGPNQGIVQKNLTEEWYCQACQEKQTDELPPYMFEYAEREFIRICSKCHNTRMKYDIQPCKLNTLLGHVRTHF